MIHSLWQRGDKKLSEKNMHVAMVIFDLLYRYVPAGSEN